MYTDLHLTEPCTSVLTYAVDENGCSYLVTALFLFKYRCLSQLPGFDAAVCFDVFRDIVLEGEDA